MGKFGDWQKGEVKDWEEFKVSYSAALPDGIVQRRTISVRVKGGKKAAGQRVVRQIKRGFPDARITIRRIWLKGTTPSGLHLPPGLDWIDDEVEGKGKRSR